MFTQSCKSSYLKVHTSDHGRRRTSSVGGGGCKHSVSFLPECPIVHSEIFPSETDFYPAWGAAAPLPPVSYAYANTMLPACMQRSVGYFSLTCHCEKDATPSFMVIVSVDGELHNMLTSFKLHLSECISAENNTSGPFAYCE